MELVGIAFLSGSVYRSDTFRATRKGGAPVSQAIKRIINVKLVFSALFVACLYSCKYASVKLNLNHQSFFERIRRRLELHLAYGKRGT
jgi:hypothetical protein